LTTHFLLREALDAAGTRDRFDATALSAISDFWERAMYQAYFYRGVGEATWPKAAHYAASLGLREDEALAAWQRVLGGLHDYLMQRHKAGAGEVIEEIAVELARLFHAPSVDLIRAHVRLLIVVGFTVASYQALARQGRPLAQRGEIPSGLVFARASSELR